MQKLIFTLLFMISLSITAQNHQTYSLDTEKSVLHWRGSYAFHFSQHNGTVSFKEGQLITDNGSITGGSFVIDMTSITNEDYLLSQGPVKHLKNGDFFDVPTFPEATLVLTSIEYFSNDNTHRIYADLTIKGITNSIKFYADVDGDQNTMKAEIIVDRTLWGITYNNRLKNDAISDAIEFQAELYFYTNDFE